jgi:hypothetical protein
MFIAAVLLLIDSFFHWQEVDYDLGPLGSGSAGVSAWDDLGGILMGILTIVLIARIAARLAAVDVPIPLSFATTSFVLGVLIAVLAVIKNLTDDYSTFMSYVGVVLAILVAVGAWMEVQQAGGVEHLMSQVPSSTGADAPAGTAPAQAAPAPPMPQQTQETEPAAAEPPAAAPPTRDADAATPDATNDEPSTERET